VRAALRAPAPEVAPRLLGWLLRTTMDGTVTSVVISEVEAYTEADPASHSAGGPTVRNASMFGPAGTLYVYRSYGIHWCVNVVTGPAGEGSAVLLRAGVPWEGREEMVRRRGRVDHLTDGPGKLTQALGIHGSHDGLDPFDVGPVQLIPGRPMPARTTSRIGISKARDTPWRWVAVGSVTSPESSWSTDDT
jgi:DNA-3-methyladenine glycosylase